MMDKLEIIEKSKKINTYDISILPFQDCCTIFEPKNPITKPNLEKVIEYEMHIPDYEGLIEKALNDIETIKISYEDKEVQDEHLF